LHAIIQAVCKYRGFNLFKFPKNVLLSKWPISRQAQQHGITEQRATPRPPAGALTACSGAQRCRAAPHQAGPAGRAHPSRLPAPLACPRSRAPHQHCCHLRAPVLEGRLRLERVALPYELGPVTAAPTWPPLRHPGAAQWRSPPPPWAGTLTLALPQPRQGPVRPPAANAGGRGAPRRPEPRQGPCGPPEMGGAAPRAPPAAAARRAPRPPARRAAGAAARPSAPLAQAARRPRPRHAAHSEAPPQRPNAPLPPKWARAAPPPPRAARRAPRRPERLRVRQRPRRRSWPAQPRTPPPAPRRKAARLPWRRSLQAGLVRRGC